MPKLVQVIWGTSPDRVKNLTWGKSGAFAKRKKVRHCAATVKRKAKG